MVHDFKVMGIILASCEEVFMSWMSDDAYGSMTGGQAVIDSKGRRKVHRLGWICFRNDD